MNKCFIFGALDINAFCSQIYDGDIVIAADGGLNNVKKFNIEPDIILGDFDSLGEIPVGDNVIIHPVKKDDTDTLLAIKTALDNGYKYIEVYGCVGGRLDHTLASVQSACYGADMGAVVVFYGENEVFTVLKDSSIIFTECATGIISVFAVSGIAEKVSISNLLYEVSDVNLTPDFPLGVSNEFVGKEAEISVKNGKLLVIWQDISADFKIGEFNE